MLFRSGYGERIVGGVAGHHHGVIPVRGIDLREPDHAANQRRIHLCGIDVEQIRISVGTAEPEKMLRVRVRKKGLVILFNFKTVLQSTFLWVDIFYFISTNSLNF